MQITINNHNSIKEALILETSKLNMINSEIFKKELKPHLSIADSRLIINFENIDFIDSSGFGALISLLKVARNNNCVLKLCNINEELYKMFELIHLHKVFDIEENINSCISNF